jgi:hypothetical protein
VEGIQPDRSWKAIEHGPSIDAHPEPRLSTHY